MLNKLVNIHIKNSKNTEMCFKILLAIELLNSMLSDASARINLNIEHNVSVQNFCENIYFLVYLFIYLLAVNTWRGTIQKYHF